MNKTVDINLGGLIFHLDEDAYNILTQYLKSIKTYLKGTQGSEEIINDIENRIAELFTERLPFSKQVITREDVQEVVAILGQPEDYRLDAEDDDFEFNTSQNTNDQRTKKKFFRDPDDKIIGGVSSGLAAYFNIDTVWIRLIFIILTIIGGQGLLIYIILWAIIPEAKTTAQKLQMRGEPVNFSTIEKKIREEFEHVKTRVEDFASSDDMRKTSSKLARSAQRFFELVFNILERFLTFIVKFFGSILMIGAGFLLFFVLVGVFSGEFTINNSVIDFYDVRPIIDVIALRPAQVQMLYIAVGLMIIAPIVGLLFLGARILFNYKMKNRVVKSAFFLLPVLGFFMLTWTSILVGKEFRERGSFVETKPLSFAPKNSVYLEVNKHPAFIDVDFPIQQVNNNILVNLVDVNIEKTTRQEPLLELKTRSRGKDLDEAREHAQMTTYQFDIQDSLLLLDNFFKLNHEGKFRGQRLEITLYLPVGHGIFFADN
ncbi:MAG: PspC domain-containing protein, partial [Schleiferiaceae bacterium]|nr:PspC domain-containing protein [Schleiferiaceae bacterium]